MLGESQSEPRIQASERIIPRSISSPEWSTAGLRTSLANTMETQILPGGVEQECIEAILAAISLEMPLVRELEMSDHVYHRIIITLCHGCKRDY